jgi:carbonic anhydrase/acetyltransferase-like protein (isoleucine patch superfamily)
VAVYALGDRVPEIHAEAYVHPEATVINRVEVPAFAMALGVPARMRLDAVPEGAYGPAVDLYVENGRRYRADLKRLD